MKKSSMLTQLPLLLNMRDKQKMRVSSKMPLFKLTLMMKHKKNLNRRTIKTICKKYKFKQMREMIRIVKAQTMTLLTSLCKMRKTLTKRTLPSMNLLRQSISSKAREQLKIILQYQGTISSQQSRLASVLSLRQPKNEASFSLYLLLRAIDYRIDIEKLSFNSRKLKKLFSMTNAFVEEFAFYTQRFCRSFP